MGIEFVELRTRDAQEQARSWLETRVLRSVNGALAEPLLIPGAAMCWFQREPKMSTASFY